jgi:hypothetical protein
MKAIINYAIGPQAIAEVCSLAAFSYVILIIFF